MDERNGGNSEVPINDVVNDNTTFVGCTFLFALSAGPVVTLLLTLRSKPALRV
jgi:hypothetical protein